MKSTLITKILSVILSVALLFSLATVGVNATEETEEYPIYLDISGTDWSAEEGVFCHIWNAQTGEIYNEWDTTDELMTVSEYGDTILKFDLATAITDFDTSEERIYGLIFGSSNGSQTHGIVMSGYCYGEFVYLTLDTSYVSQDSSQKMYYGEFRGFSYDYGTRLAIDSSNRVYGHALFENETSAMVLATYIVEKALFSTSILNTDTLNQLLVEVQATIADTKEEIAPKVDDLISNEIITTEDGLQLKEKIFTALDSCTDPVLGKNIYFDVFYSGWNPTETFYCHVWNIDDTGNWNEWRSEAEKCVYDEAAGVAIYDLNKTGNDISGDEVKYLVMFGSSDGEVSPFATMNGDCVGDSAYVATYWDEYSDVEYTHLFWEKSTDCGPIKEINSDSEIIGFSLPYGTTDEMVLSDYLINNAASLTAENVQNLINGLKITVASAKSQVEKALNGTDDEKLKQIMAVLDQCADSDVHIFGDVNCDGVVNVTDATAIAKYLAELDDIENELLKYTDVNRDGVVSVMDVTHIQKISAGLI